MRFPVDGGGPSVLGSGAIGASARVEAGVGVETGSSVAGVGVGGVAVPGEGMGEFRLIFLRCVDHRPCTERLSAFGPYWESIRALCAKRFDVLHTEISIL